MKYFLPVWKYKDLTSINNGPDRDHTLWQEDRTLVDELESRLKLYVESLGLTASGFDFLLTSALMHCDNKPIQNW